MKKYLLYLFLPMSLLFGFSESNAQNCDLIFTTQTEIDNFSPSMCTSYNSVTIEDAGSDPIVDLTPLSPISNISTFLIIKDCNSLTALTGLENVGTVNSLDIDNCFALTDVSALFNLSGSMTRFDITSAPQIIDYSGFNNISTVGYFRLFDVSSASDISGFNGLSFANTFRLNGSFGVSSITGFTSLSSVDNFVLRDFYDLTSFEFPALSVINANFSILKCSDLTDISGFISLTSIAGDFSLFDNTSLSDCCIINDIVGIIGGTINIYNNDSGCNSLADIGSMAPSFTCPPDMTVGLDFGLECEAPLTFLHPTPTDDCGVLNSSFTLTAPNGTQTQSGPLDIVSPSYYQFIDQGNWVFEFSATDENGLTGTCSMIVNVADLDSPNWDNPSGLFVSTTGECGVDDPLVLANGLAPTANDDCGIPTVNLINTNAVSNCGGTETITYTYQAVDDSGNINPNNSIVEVILEDNASPVLSALPANVTITCNDSYPSIPNVTSMDACEGDLSASIVLTTNVIPGDCSLTVPAEITEYTWTSTDGCGNSSSSTWIVTVDNNFVTDLGPDVFECYTGSATLQPTPLGSSYLWSTGETTQSINVTTTGNYSVTVTTQNGCCSIDDAFVTISNPPNISATGGGIDCSGNGVTIQGNSTTNGVTYDWVGPNGFTSNIQSPLVFDLGFYTLTVTDSDGCVSTETVEVISIPDTNAPTWDDLNLFLSINGECGVDDPQVLANNNLPTATDDCTQGIVTFAFTETSSICGNSEMISFFYQLQDLDGNLNPDYYVIEITLVDTNAPTLSGIPSDMTINCDDALPNIPSPTADDLCAGDITNQITTTSSVSVGNCDNGTASEIQEYVWTVDDGCGNTTSESWTLTINNNFTTSLGPDRVECMANGIVLQTNNTGSSYTWSTGQTSPSISVSASGMYSVTVTSQNGCCAIDEIEVTFSTAPNISATGGSLDCIGTPVSLQGNSNTPNVNYAWSGPNGYNSNLQNPTTSQVGAYTLTVTNIDGCESMQTVQVTPDTNAPDINTSGGSLTCLNSDVTITANSTTNGVSYSWSGPNGYSSNMQNNTVTTPGNYTCEVMAPNGCISIAAALVVDDTSIPDVSATGGALTCSNTQVTLNGNSTTSNVTYAWSGPNGYSSTDQNPMVAIAGQYTLTVTGQNGCANDITVMVTEAVDAPDISAQGGTLNCNFNSITLMGNSTTSGVSYSWSGPGGFMSNDQNPEVSMPGDYTLTVSNASGCSSIANVEVNQNLKQPNISATGDIITCNNTLATLTGSSSTPNVSYFWSGPNGFTSSNANTTTNVAGSYTLEITALNGCVNTSIVEVTLDNEAPNASAKGGVINCKNPSITLEGNSTTPNVDYLWTGPNGFSSNNQNADTNLPGTYNLDVIAANGCVSSVSLEITQNTTAPHIEATGATLTCTQLLVTLMGNSNTPGVTYEWTGPDGSVVTEQNPSTTYAGTYTLVVTAKNGCTNSTQVEVTTDDDIPEISASGGSITCSTNSVTLQGNSTTQNVTYRWTGPQGFDTNDQNPSTTVAGTYRLDVTGPNGCRNTQTVEVVSDMESPNISVQDGTLDCNNTSVTLIANSTTEDVTYEWTGPNGFSSDDQNPSATMAGIYTVEITASNGCTSSMELTIAQDITEADGEISQISIDCDDKSIMLELTTDAIDPMIEWNGPNNFSSDQAIVNLNEFGLYSAVITGSNGCETTIEYQVDDIFNYQTDITTVQDSTFIEITGGTGPFEIMWDNGDTGDATADLSAGIHKVTVIDGLGCVREFGFEIIISSINDLTTNSGLKAFPNPMNQEAKIEWDAKVFSPEIIEVYNTQGQMIFKSNITNEGDYILNGSHFETGMYIISLRNNDQLANMKIIKL